MDSSFNNQIESFVNKFLNSCEGQLSILLSMASVVNQKNITNVTKIISEGASQLSVWKDLKHISTEIKTLLDCRANLITTQNYELLCDSILEICQIVVDYQSKSVNSLFLEEKTEKIKESLMIFNLAKRLISVEDLLEEFGDDTECSESTNNTAEYSERRMQSELAKYGYSVSKNSGLTNKQRQDILHTLIEKNKVSKYYIISYLKHIIAINGKKESNYLALQKWKSDLDYVMSR